MQVKHLYLLIISSFCIYAIQGCEHSKLSDDFMRGYEVGYSESIDAKLPDFKTLFGIYSAAILGLYSIEYYGYWYKNPREVSEVLPVLSADLVELSKIEKGELTFDQSNIKNYLLTSSIERISHLSFVDFYKKIEHELTIQRTVFSILASMQKIAQHLAYPLEVSKNLIASEKIQLSFAVDRLLVQVREFLISRHLNIDKVNTMVQMNNHVYKFLKTT